MDGGNRIEWDEMGQGERGVGTSAGGSESVETRDSHLPEV